MVWKIVCDWLYYIFGYYIFGCDRPTENVITENVMYYIFVWYYIFGCDNASVNSMMEIYPMHFRYKVPDSMSMWSKPGKTVPLGHWKISFETKTDHVLACIEIIFRTNNNAIIFTKSSMVFPWPVVISQKLCATSFSAQRKLSNFKTFNSGSHWRASIVFSILPTVP